jgi:hypothetical protein
MERSKVSGGKMVTVCVTSCNRPNLLFDTIESFLSLNTYPITKFVVIEDSNNENIIDKLSKQYSFMNIIFNNGNIGQIKSIDRAYKDIHTKYIFHIEDDYKFHGNSNFIKESIDILEENDNIHQVWVRHIENYNTSHNTIEGMFEHDTKLTSNGSPYKMVSSPHCGNWCGFSFNPGLRRLSDYHKIFPNGYSELLCDGDQAVMTEFKCNARAMENNYRAAVLLNGACDNIGHNQSTYRQ